MIFLNYLLSALAIGVTFLFGCTGEIIIEKAGHLNLGVPGIMCTGAAMGCLSLSWIKPMNLPSFLVVIIAVIFSILGGAIMGLLYSFLTVSLKANQNVTGLALTIFGVGLTDYIMLGLKGSQYLYAKSFFRAPFNKSTTSLQYCGVLVFVAIIIAVVAAFVLKKTKIGLNLRAVGENPATADAAGIDVTKYKYLATIIGAGIAGIGGLYYILDYSGSQESYLAIEALGWISVALVIFSLWKPVLAVFGSILFGALYIAGSYLPSIVNGLSMSSVPFLKMLPYLVTIIVLLITSVKNKRENQPPASLGVNYFREDR